MIFLSVPKFVPVTVISLLVIGDAVLGLIAVTLTVLSAVYVKSTFAVRSPNVAVIGKVSPVCAGVIAVILTFVTEISSKSDPSNYNVNPVIATLSREDGKPVPVIVTTVPPFNDPSVGLTVVIVKGTNSPTTTLSIFENPICSA
jgi:hypothetical protein